ncbi:MAG: efflux RND transporter periplasmic adaptor subunit [Bacteroidia bacterium]|nr:efflux RND transporter periplasmic adaptor subunit [Bacteroidia bacterium]
MFQKNLLYIFTASAILLVSAACGKKAETLQDKQKLLLEKKAELRSISEEITSLESEIAKLDPSTKERARIAFVGVQQVEGDNFKHYIDVQGQVEAKDNVSVGPQGSGKITQIFVKEGQAVKAGQLLGRVDDALIQASIAEVETQLILAQDLLGRQQRLWEQGIGTKVQLLEAENRVESLNKRVQTQKEQLSMMRITSPISGTVEEVIPKVGEMVSPGFPAFRIVNNADLSLKAELSETYVGDVRKGDNVIVEFPAVGKSIDAKVAVVGETIHPNDRTFEVEVSLPRNSGLKPNMFGTLRINDETATNAVVLPISLVQQSEDGPFVFVATEKEGKWTAERRMLETSLNYGGKTIITKGIAVGDYLITSGYNDLSDGQEISFDMPLAGN